MECLKLELTVTGTVIEHSVRLGTSRDIYTYVRLIHRDAVYSATGPSNISQIITMIYNNELFDR